MVNLIEIFTIKNIIIYIVIINIISFLMMGLDKLKSIKGQWRIKEETLFLFVLLGGSIGGIIGIYAFKHKTRKKYFTIGFPVILTLQIALTLYILYK